MRKRLLPLLLTFIMILGLCPIASAEDQDCGAKLIAITFDDGPGLYTDSLLDGLAERGVRATFFVAGYRAVEYPQTLERIVNEGHQLANHTYNHRDLNAQSVETIRWEINGTQNLITNAGGSECAYIRPPYGNANSTVLSNADAPIIIWSVDPLDWQNFNSEIVRQNIVRGSYDGAIILVHDIYRTSVNGALAAIDDLQAAGYEFVTVEELLLRRGVTPKAGTRYYDAKNQGINLTAEQISPEYYDETRLDLHWGYPALCFCVERGFMTLSPEGKYLPNRYVTRAEFVTALASLCKAPLNRVSRDLFEDVDAMRPEAASIYWAYDQNLMVGHGSTFEPDAILTREQMAAVVARFLRAKGVKADAFAVSAYTDWKKISDWAVEDVCFCSGLEILSGSTNGSFLPLQPLTRAELASMLQRLTGYQSPEKASHPGSFFVAQIGNEWYDKNKNGQRRPLLCLNLFSFPARRWTDCLSPALSSEPTGCLASAIAPLPLTA